MKQFLLTMSVLAFVGVEASASEERCQAASKYITHWTYGGASEDFVRNRFFNYFEEDLKDPVVGGPTLRNEAFRTILEGTYLGISMFGKSNKAGAAVFIVEEAVKWSCNPINLETYWK